MQHNVIEQEIAQVGRLYNDKESEIIYERMEEDYSKEIIYLIIIIYNF